VERAFIVLTDSIEVIGVTGNVVEYVFIIGTEGVTEGITEGVTEGVTEGITEGVNDGDEFILCNSL